MSDKVIRRPKYTSYEVLGEKYTFPANVNDAKLGDTTGFVDQWPAYSSKRMISSKSLSLNRNGNLIVFNERETKLPNLTPKPKLLEYLERYISKQLKKHHAESIEPTAIRLEIYREVFDDLANAFKTYKPLFSDIKREYDSMISKLREDIRGLEPMKEMIWTISEERNQEVLKIKEQEKQEMINLRADKMELLKVIGELDANEQTLNIQIETLKQKLEEEHLAYRNEADARRLLIIDINEIRQHLDDLTMTKKNEEEQSSDDPYILKLGLEETKKAHSQLLSKITKMEIDYVDVVPKRDFEHLTEDHRILNESAEINSKRVAELEVEHQLLEERFTALQQQRDFYYTKYMDLAATSTPRPDWKKFGEVIPNGATWWNEQTKEKSSKEMLGLVLQEVTKSTSVTNEMDAKGTEASVPAFLRLTGKVKLRFMPKRDVKIHIREIMEERKNLKKEQNDAISKSREYLLPSWDDHLDLFFKKIYGIEKIRYEWAYTFYESLLKETTDDKIIQFRKMFNNEMDEDAYWDEMVYLDELRTMIKSKDTESKNLISKDDFKLVLETFITKKDDDEFIPKLMTAVVTDLSAQDQEFLAYESLFMIDDEGEYGVFITNILKLFKEEKQKYVSEIAKELRDCESKISCEQLKGCIQIVDPSISEDILNKYILWCFECKSMEEAKKMDSLSPDLLVSRLTWGAVRRTGPRN